MPPTSVLVIGGGLAGLASAVALAEAGSRVRLLEKRPHVGGRAASYQLPDGSHVDNCQHVTLGCCTNLQDFYRRAGSAENIRFYDRLYFCDRRGRSSTIEAAPLPAPLHLAVSFAMFSGLRVAAKLAIARAMIAIARCGGQPSDARGITMLEWLLRHGQPTEAVERFWRVVLVSALNETLGRCEARYGVEVFWKGFLASRSGYRVGIPSVALGELYAGCRVALERRGGELHTRAGVRELRVGGERMRSVVLEDGSEMSADCYLMAVPHTAALELLPPELLERAPALGRLRELKTSPITGIHLWFDREVMPQPFLALLDLTVQWIFNKSMLSGPAGTAASDRIASRRTGPSQASAGQYLQLVISACYDLVSRSRQEIIELCRRDLAEVLPATREAVLVKATVIKETAATFSPAPGSEDLRPGPRGPLDNLYFAGDWTRTGWPATMEGAVRSGYLAAEAILADAGQPASFLQPDLPAEGLARIWAAN